MKKIKKIIALILCFSITASLVAALAYAEDSSETAVADQTAGETADAPSSGKSQSNEDIYPIVFVTGIGQSYSYLYENEADAKADVADNSTDRAVARWNLFCNDFSFAFKEPKTYIDILSVAGGLFASLITGFNCISKRSVDSLVKTLFRYNTVDENGKLPANVVTPRMDYPVSKYTQEQRDNFYRSIPCADVIGDIGEDMLYCFNYSAFSFTFNNSDDLDKFIEKSVLPQTGKDKVVLIPMSMGASVVSAYLHDYGTKGRVDKVVSIVGAWEGSNVIADLIDLAYAEDAPEKLYNGIVSDLIGEPWGYLVNVILHLFPKATLRSIIDEILNSVVENLVLKTPSLFGIVPTERYKSIRASRLEGKPELEYIMNQTDRYYKVQCELKDTVMKLNKDYGVDFFYIAGYGLGFGEFSSDYEFFRFLATADKTNSDEIIEISSTATGASFVTRGTQFSDSYLSSHDAEYITPDKSVDISTCFFPDRVWLFEKQKHELENNNTALKLAFDLALGRIDSTKDENNIYPRFNGSRDLKPLKRNYIPDLEKWLESNKPTAAQQKLIDENTEAVNKMMDSVVNDREADNKVIENYYNMLVTLGVYEKSEDKGESAGTKILKSMNDTTYRLVGPKGFRDKLFGK